MNEFDFSKLPKSRSIIFATVPVGFPPPPGFIERQ